jgi:tetratricopeptide (TPR) repeat protein
MLLNLLSKIFVLICSTISQLGVRFQFIIRSIGLNFKEVYSAKVNWLTNRDKNLKNGIQLLLREMSYQAIEYLVQVVEEDPKFAYAWIYLSAAYFNTRNLHKAYCASNTVLNLDPENLSICLIRGSIFLEWGLYEMAIECFDKYLLRFPDDDIILSEKAYCHYNIGQINETIECFDKILELFPEDENVLEQRSNLLEEQQLNQAIPAA